MPCLPFRSDDGRITGFVCTRGRRPAGKCATCGEKGPALECDKCDAKLCRGCGVSPREGVDLCPGCARPAFNWWLTSQWLRRPVADPLDTRAVRRQQFRFWVRAHVPQFLELTNFTMPGSP